MALCSNQPSKVCSSKSRSGPQIQNVLAFSKAGRLPELHSDVMPDLMLVTQSIQFCIRSSEMVLIRNAAALFVNTPLIHRNLQAVSCIRSNTFLKDFKTCDVIAAQNAYSRDF